MEDKEEIICSCGKEISGDDIYYFSIIAIPAHEKYPVLNHYKSCEECKLKIARILVQNKREDLK